MKALFGNSPLGGPAGMLGLTTLVGIALIGGAYFSGQSAIGVMIAAFIAVAVVAAPGMWRAASGGGGTAGHQPRRPHDRRLFPP